MTATVNTLPYVWGIIIEVIAMLSGFKAFLLRGNVVDLAIAVVIGAAFTAVVTAFVKDLLTPLIAAIGGNPDFSGLYFTINNSKFLFGDFINAVIAFIIVAAVVYYLVVVPMNRLAGLNRKPTVPPAPTTRKCPECLSEIPLAATRCAYCTSQVTPVATAN
jgi:large conductance mechanosensitive channel